MADDEAASAATNTTVAETLQYAQAFHEAASADAAAREQTALAGLWRPEDNRIVPRIGAVPAIPPTLVLFHIDGLVRCATCHPFATSHEDEPTRFADALTSLSGGRDIIRSMRRARTYRRDRAPV